MFQFGSFINSVTIVHFSLFSCFLVFSKKHGHISNRIFALFLISEALATFDTVVFGNYSFFYTYFPHIFYLFTSFMFCKGPSLYFYTKSLTYRPFRFAWKDTLHLVPFFAFTVYLAAGFILRSTDTKRMILQTGSFPSLIGMKISLGILHFLILSYLIASLRLLRRYTKAIKESVSSIDRISLRWLQFILFGFIGMWSMWFASYLLFAFTSRSSMTLDLIGMTLLFITANIIIYNGLHLPELFLGIEEKPKYKDSPLSDEEKEAYLAKLTSYMNREKPYHDPALTIGTLSEALAIIPRHLSQVINERLNRNFYDFVNSYRIEEAKLMLSDPNCEDKTVLEILYEVGFNSKSAFNLAFKSQTGMTPTEFRRRRAVSIVA